MPKFPHIVVPLVGHDGNAFAILGSVRKAMSRGGVPKEDIDAYFNEATKGDYDHLLQVTMNTVTTSVDHEDDDGDDDAGDGYYDDDEDDDETFDNSDD